MWLIVSFYHEWLQNVIASHCNSSPSSTRQNLLVLEVCEQGLGAVTLHPTKQVVTTLECLVLRLVGLRCWNPQPLTMGCVTVLAL